MLQSFIPNDIIRIVSDYVYPTLYYRKNVFSKYTYMNATLRGNFENTNKLFVKTDTIYDVELMIGTLGHIGVLKYLVGNKAVDIKTIFNTSCKNGNWHVLKYIRNTNIFDPDRMDRQNAIVCASKKNNLDIIKYITEIYMLTNFGGISDKTFRQMLVSACYVGNINIIKYIKSAYKLNCIKVIDFINIVFRSVCLNGNMDLIEYVENECNVKIYRLMNKYDQTPVKFKYDTDYYSNKYVFKENDSLTISLQKSLMYSCLAKNLNVVKYLVDKYNITTSNIISTNMIVLKAACNSHNGSPDIIKYLCEKFELNRKHIVASKHGLSPYCSACAGMYVDVLLYLENKFNITRDDVLINNSIAFRQAGSLGRVDVLKHLNDKYGITRHAALYADNRVFVNACERGHIDVLKYLNEKYNITRDEVMTENNDSLTIACERGRLDVVKYLVDTYKLQHDIIFHGDPSCFHIACADDNIELVEYFIEKFNLPRALNKLDIGRLRMPDSFLGFKYVVCFVEMKECLRRHGLYELVL